MKSQSPHVHPRARGRLLARYGVEKLDRTAFTMNVSMVGAFVRTNMVYKPGTMLQLELSNGARKIVLAARVVWAKKVPAEMSQLLMCGMGLRFVSPGPEWSDFFEGWAAERGLAPEAK